MSHKVGSKLKSRILFFILAIFLVPLLTLSPIFSQKAAAAVNITGSKETMMQKLYARAVLDSFNTWAYGANVNDNTARNVPLSKISDKMSTMMDLDGGWHSEISVGRYMEYIVQNKYDDGKIWADGAQGDAFWQGAFQSLGITGTKPIDIICHGVGGPNNYEGANILKPRLGKYSDGSIMPTEYQPQCSSAEYFDALFTADGGGKNVAEKTDERVPFALAAENQAAQFLKDKSTVPKKPDGSIDLSLTDIEKYYLYTETFLPMCTTGSVVPDTSNYTDPKYKNNNTTLPKSDYAFTMDLNDNRFFKVYLIEGSTPTIKYYDPLMNRGLSGQLSDDFMLEKNSFISCYDIANILADKDSAWVQEIATTLAEAGTVLTPPTGSEDLPNDPVEPSCYNNAAELGWILCPIITGLGNAIEGIYDDYIVPQLNIDANLLNPDKDGSTTYEAWTTFQSIANIAFIIFLLIVIFSQVTGVGIDNYGIKKALPKLIIAAVLINLSFIICQLAVDLSNILGNGLRTVLINVAPSVSSKLFLGDSAVEGMGKSLLPVLVVGIVGAGAILASGFAVLLPLALGLLSAIISIIFLFILLGVRQAGVILLTVLAPVAIVCYMLPNTKSMFDRWRKMFTGLLLLFPICGLMIGAGELASRILLAANPDTFSSALVAVLINVVPFFFIPTLLKNSFAAMGNIGAKISGMGSSFGKGLTGKIRNSEGYRQTRNKWAAGKEGGLRERVANTRFGRLVRGRSGMVRARGAYLKDQRDFGREEDLMGVGYRAEQANIDRQRAEQNINSEEALVQQSIDTGIDGYQDDKHLIETMHNSTNRNQQYAIARHLASYKSGVQAFAKYASGGYKDSNNNVMANTFGASEKDRQQFASVMMSSKNFGNIGKFSPDLEEHIVNMNSDTMDKASAEVSVSPSKISTATDDSLERMWEASSSSPARRQQLIDAMTEAIRPGSTTVANIKGKERAWINNHLPPTPEQL